MLSIREGREEDLDRITEIKLRTWSDTYAPLIPPDVLSPFLDRVRQLQALRHETSTPGALFLVAVDAKGEVVGFALTFLDRSPDPWLESLHVHPDSQGRGVGTQLMRATAGQLRVRGHDSMRLGVVAGNLAAERFYERLGGISDGFEPTDWAPGVTHHLYRWPDLEVLA